MNYNKPLQRKTTRFIDTEHITMKDLLQLTNEHLYVPAKIIRLNQNIQYSAFIRTCLQHVLQTLVYPSFVPTLVFQEDNELWDCDLDCTVDLDDSYSLY